MPCYRCGARQSDPQPGKPSSWKRGVRREHQVLVCPDCFPVASGDLDRCPGCGGTQLIRRLDQVECLSCGLTRDASDVNDVNDVNPEPGPPSPEAPAPGASEPGSPPAPDSGALAEEVASALDRVLRWR